MSGAIYTAKDLKELFGTINETVKEKDRLAVRCSARSLFRLQKPLNRLLGRRNECDALLNLYKVLKKNNMKYNGKEIKTKLDNRTKTYLEFVADSEREGRLGFMTFAYESNVSSDDSIVYIGMTANKSYGFATDKTIIKMIYDERIHDYKYLGNDNTVIITASSLYDSAKNILEYVKELDDVEFYRVANCINDATYIFEGQLDSLINKYYEHAKKELGKIEEVLEYFEEEDSSAF